MATTSFPLLFDVHSHADRGPEQEHKGTLETETKSALASGFGTILVMPNCKPEITTHKTLREARGRARNQIYCDVGFHFGTRGDNTQEFPHVWPFVRGIKIYLDPTTGGMNIPLDKAERVFAAWSRGSPILVHCEGGNLIRQVIKLAETYRQRVHICHVNLAEQVGVIRQAKYNGIDITAEVCPHHLIFFQDDIEHLSLGGYGVMKPPLATETDVEVLWQAIQDGTIDIIATDHAPHSAAEKESYKPAFGVISEPTFSVLWTDFSARKLPIELLIKLMVTRPAQIFGLPIDTTSTMEVDLDSPFVLEPKMVQSKARSPYQGMQLWGRIRKIHLHGTLVFEDGEFLAREGRVI